MEPVLYSKNLATSKGHPFGFLVLYSYKDSIKNIIQSLKFSKDLKMARIFCSLVLESVDLGFNPDLIIPVPSHPVEEIKRGFSHMGYVAHMMSKSIGVDFNYCLKRKFFPFFGRTQKSRTRRKRKDIGLNIYMNNKDLSVISDKKILLIDDVSTTGTSIRSCASLLMENGAKSVHAVCLGLAPY